MRKLSFTALLLLLLLFIPNITAQNSIRGKVTNENNHPLAGASVTLKQTRQTVHADRQGEFEFRNLTDYAYTVLVKYVGYEPVEKIIQTGTATTFLLKPNDVRLDEIIVSATRAGAQTPVAFTNVSAETMRRNNAANNLPVILESLPSLVAFTEGGTGVGNTSLRIRGTDATRINVTLNGMPLNNPESQEVYWVNLPDLSSSLQSVQLQRGIGTSTNGGSAFGATLSMKTSGGRTKAYGEATTGVGSYNTFTSAIAAGTGIMRGGISADARYSRLLSDGYIRNGKVNHQNLHLALSHYADHGLIRLLYMHGEQHTGITWEGVTAEQMNDPEYGRRYNPAGEYYDDAGNRLYYPNETDNYFSDIVQLLFSRKINANLSLNAAVNWNHGFGYYENLKTEQELKKKFGFEPQTIAGKTYAYSDVHRRKLMENDFYVANADAIYTRKALKVTAGAMYSLYSGNHYGQLPWVKYNENISPNAKWYENNGKKREFNVFVKSEYAVTGKISAFADVQGRFISYQLTGKDDDFGDVTGSYSYRFFNPKAGVFYRPHERHALYASVAAGNREPLRADLKDSKKQGSKSEIQPERMWDYEAGYRFTHKAWLVGMNFYYMDYHNQMVQTGRLTDVGYKLMENVKNSHRTGIELEASVPVVENKLQIDANATLSGNKINNYTAYFDIYEKNSAGKWKTTGQKTETYNATDISFSPSVVSAAAVTYRPFSGLSLRLSGKYVGKQYLDNTSDNEKSIAPYFVSNAALSYSFQPAAWGAIDIDLYVNNLLNAKYIANGYASTAYYRSGNTDTRSDWVGLYPQAERNFMVKMTVRF